MEAHDAECGREREGTPALLRRRTLPHRAQERVDDRVGIVGEELPSQVGDLLVAQLSAQCFTVTPHLRQPLVGMQHESSEVVRVSPLTSFF